MDVLYQNQDADHHTAQQRNDLVPLLVETKEKQELRSRMTRVEQVLGDKALPVEGVAQRVGQRDQVWRGI